MDMDIELITHATAFAAEAHSFQKRKASDVPYVNHLVRVAHEAARAKLSVEAVAAAVLHDVVEDTEVTLEVLRKSFSERVVYLVNLLTKWWPDDASLEVQQAEKPRYYAGILQDQEAIALKLLDRADNLNDMTRGLPKIRNWATRYLKKTELEVEPIFDACENKHARSQYRLAVETLRKALQAHSE